MRSKTHYSLAGAARIELASQGFGDPRITGFPDPYDFCDLFVGALLFSIPQGSSAQLGLFKTPISVFIEATKESNLAYD
jgi:hypothetical protein